MEPTIIKTSTFFLKKHVFFILFIIIILILVATELWLVDFLSKNEGDNITKFNAAAMIILTIILVYVAGRNLGSLSSISEADFLFRVDARYGSAEIIMARTIVQKFYARTKATSEDKDLQIAIIQNEIKRLGENEDTAEEYTYLLNFLDFLETIAYFAGKGFIKNDDVKELAGNSIFFYYKIFFSWISNRRTRYGDDSLYNMLEKLVENMKRNKNMSHFEVSLDNKKFSNYTKAFNFPRKFYVEAESEEKAKEYCRSKFELDKYIANQIFNRNDLEIPEVNIDQKLTRKQFLKGREEKTYHSIGDHNFWWRHEISV